MNESLRRTFVEMAGKKPEETSVVFVTTASNVETGDKSWVIKDLTILKEMKIKKIMMTDISAVPESVWRPQFEEADVMIFEGGNTFYLMEWIAKSGLNKLLPELLQTRVWVGISAGSMVPGPDLKVKVEHLFGESLDKNKDLNALGLTDFYILPHCNDEHLNGLNRSEIEAALGKQKIVTYALDDQSAVKVIDGSVEVISEGKWFKIN